MGPTTVLVRFTAYVEAAWGGTRAHLDILDDLHTLQERLMQSGVEASIRVRDVRVMSGLVYRAKRVGQVSMGGVMVVP